MTNTTEAHAPAWQLQRLSNELRAFLAGIPAELHAEGHRAAPRAVAAFAKWLRWHAPKFDAATPSAPLSIATLADEITAAVRPLLPPANEPPPVPAYAERIARLEAEIATLREVLAARQGEAL